MISDETVNFKIEKDKNIKAREILKEVYITSHNEARNKIRQVERDELLEKMVKNYIGLDD